MVKRWTNIYRIDDIVGTTVNGLDGTGTAFPKNVRLQAVGGHTRYWTEDDAIGAMGDDLDAVGA